MAFSKGDVGLSGRIGGRVYRQVGRETIVSEMPVKVNPRTPKQMASRDHLQNATWLWGKLPPDAMDRWRLYGMRLGRRGDLVFRGLGAKYLQLHGGGTVPTEPPDSPFAGDGVRVSVAALPIPPAGSDSADERVEFSPSGSNAEGIVTELLLQRMTQSYCKPKPDGYRTQAFVAFEGKPVAIPARRGAWACAVRFVRAATGQASEIVPLGVVVVD